MRYAAALPFIFAFARPAPAATPRSPVASRVPAILSGRVVDSKTGAGIPGVDVTAYPPPPTGDRILLHPTLTLTDEHGAYRIALAPNTYDLVASVDGVSDDHEHVVLAPGATTRDFVLDHDAVIAARRARPPIACRDSPPGTVLRGHSASPRDIDEIARAVLERAATDPAAIPEARDTANVQAEIALPAGRRLTASAVPAGSSLRTHADLQAEADRTGKNVWYVDFSELDTDGTCALITVSGGMVVPSPARNEWAPCDGVDLYEKRDGRWVFVRRVGEFCG